MHAPHVALVWLCVLLGTRGTASSSQQRATTTTGRTAPVPAQWTSSLLYTREEISRIAKDIACDYCGLLVEDMWSMTVQNMVGQRIDSSVQEESLEWLGGLCRQNSQMLARFVGLYDISQVAPGGKYRIKRDVPWEGDPSGAFTPSYGYVGEYEQPVAEKAAEESRQWMQRVFARACVDYLMGRDLDIAEALSAHVASFNSTFERLVDLESTRAAFSDDERRVVTGAKVEQEVSTLIAEGQAGVATAACQTICNEVAPKKKGKKKDKARQTKTKKAQKKKKKKQKKG